MPTWDPGQYLINERHRTRAAEDLLSRVTTENPSRVIDLGCGPGNSTALLAERWPQARITGVDSSPDMLAAAGKRLPGVRFLLADIASWQPEETVDVIFANAVLQWLPDHPRLCRRLLSSLNPGGMLAIQVPANFGGPTHTSMAEIAGSPRWRSQLEGVLVADPVAEPEEYVRMLSGASRSIDVWDTTYYHLLQGDDPVLEWVRGAGLRPVLDTLGTEAAEFTEEYRQALRSRYPSEPDGTTIFPFRRIFVVVTRD